jgi:septal ring factor EnvC (AmiA/AmiB activator)
VDFLALYQDLTVRVLARNCAELTGKFELQTQSEDERRQALAQCREMEREIESLKAALRKETQFAEKVELNTNIKALEARLNHAVAAL